MPDKEQTGKAKKSGEREKGGKGGGRREGKKRKGRDGRKKKREKKGRGGECLGATGVSLVVGNK